MALAAVGLMGASARYVLAAGGSATWLTTAASNLWTPATTDDNWSTGAGNSPGSAGGNTNVDVATFNSPSNFTSISVSPAITLNSMIFDTANVASYTITRTANTQRLSNGGSIRMTSTVTNSQTIAGSWNVNFLGSTSTAPVSYNFTNDSTTPTAILTFSGGTISNSSGNTTVGATSTLNLTGANTGLNTISSNIAQQSARPMVVSKQGTGTWILASTSNSYTGATTIAGGLLAITGNTSAASAVSVGVSGTLGGTGSVNGTIDNSGAIAPGVNGVGTLNVASTVTFESGSALDFDVGLTATTADTDLLAFAGTAANLLLGSGNATLALTGSIDYTQTYTIVQNTASTGFTFASITGYDATDFTANFGQSGNNYVLSFTPVGGAAPEPASVGLLGLGLFALGARRRRK